MEMGIAPGYLANDNLHVFKGFIATCMYLDILKESPQIYFINAMTGQQN